MLYRIASILLLLFAIVHTMGFRQIDPKWGIDFMIQSMRSIHFNANGSERTYWDFFAGCGLFVTVLMVLASIILWQLGGLSPEALSSMRLTAWSFVLCFTVIAYLSWRYLFLGPVIFSAAILLCLGLAAWLSGAPR
ncbi:MAG: hypothetical protein M3Z35_12625 [Nitrospirota bacterium]|nr:hypothetical protein [Nitrospirota bacterium]